MDIERLRKAVTDKRFILSANPDWREGRACGLTDDKTEKKANEAITIILENIAELVVAYLIDAHQSVKSEEVAEAIEYFEDTLQFIVGEPQEKDHRLAIAALQEYQPWIPVSERLPTEEDADENGHILAYSEGLQRSTICLWYHIIGDNTTTHWRKNIEPPKGETP